MLHVLYRFLSPAETVAWKERTIPLSFFPYCMFRHLVIIDEEYNPPPSLQIADVSSVVASLPPKNNGGREATRGNTSAVRMPSRTSLPRKLCAILDTLFGRGFPPFPLTIVPHAPSHLQYYSIETLRYPGFGYGNGLDGKPIKLKIHRVTPGTI